MKRLLRERTVNKLLREHGKEFLINLTLSLWYMLTNPFLEVFRAHPQEYQNVL